MDTRPTASRCHWSGDYADRVELFVGRIREHHARLQAAEKVVDNGGIDALTGRRRGSLAGTE
jgi:hypothetical protein